MFTVVTDVLILTVDAETVHAAKAMIDLKCQERVSDTEDEEEIRNLGNDQVNKCTTTLMACVGATTLMACVFVRIVISRFVSLHI